MNITKIAVLRIGGHAHRYLSEKPRPRAVISAFQYGFNMLFDEDSVPGFVSFQTDDAPLHPWAVAAKAVGGIRASDRAVAESNRIRFSPCDVSIDLSNATVAELRIRTVDERRSGTGSQTHAID